MNYGDLLISLSGTTPQEALDILCANPDHENKSGYESIIKKDPICADVYYELKDKTPEEVNEILYETNDHKKKFHIMLMLMRKTQNFSEKK